MTKMEEEPFIIYDEHGIIDVVWINVKEIGKKLERYRDADWMWEYSFMCDENNFGGC